MQDQLETYQQMHISGLNQKDLIVSLYSGAIRFMEQGKEHMARNDIQGTHDNLSRARNIFIHLLSTLDMEKGGEISRKLSSLYAYFIEKITLANVTKNQAELNDILPLVKNIKESWEAIEFEGETMKNPRTANGFAPICRFSAEV